MFQKESAQEARIFDNSPNTARLDMLRDTIENKQVGINADVRHTAACRGQKVPKIEEVLLVKTVRTKLDHEELQRDFNHIMALLVRPISRFGDMHMMRLQARPE